ncbi:DoxX family protein [Dyella psychrodurans]|uniref:DoxX family protein n=1 Tax=Dyella psychrodurans TaxID=1927960 RepID=A0A370XCS0_9GAMM|nr:DoxX family protein [Dyella psychrodurans]RDS86102.1 DoxX family protein [Dyella psychrodurans]
MTSLAKAEWGRDGILLVSRVLLMLLFLIFGLTKLTGFDETVTLFAHMDVPFPTLATLIAIAAEVGIGIALVAGLFTRPLAVLMAVYTCATSVLGHHYWSLAGSERFLAEIAFYKNICIVGGLLLLYLTGPGRYSLDQKLRFL